MAMHHSSPPMGGPPLDVVLWGATGHTGKLVATALARVADRSRGAAVSRVGLAGRSASRLQAVEALMRQNDPQRRLAHVEVIAVDSAALTGGLDSAARELAARVCSRAPVVIALAGPFADAGEPMVRACAETGTDYVDITGELDWVARMQRKYNPVAARSGARIVHCCGFDYLLNDIGVAAATEAVGAGGAAADSGPVIDVKQTVLMKGLNVSGGTMRSVIALMRRLSREDLRALKNDPYFIATMAGARVPPAAEKLRPKNGFLTRPVKAEADDAYLAPGVMTSSMVSFVHWANLSAKRPYAGKLQFLVGDVAASWFAATAKSFTVKLAMAWLFFLSLLPDKVANFFLPKSGGGVSLNELERPDYRVEVTTTAKGGSTASVAHCGVFPRGEGYAMTAYGALGCALVARRQRAERRNGPGGVGHATDLLGLKDLVEELTENEGFQFALKRH